MDLHVGGGGGVFMNIISTKGKAQKSIYFLEQVERARKVYAGLQKLYQR